MTKNLHCLSLIRLATGGSLHKKTAASGVVHNYTVPRLMPKTEWLCYQLSHIFVTLASEQKARCNTGPLVTPAILTVDCFYTFSLAISAVKNTASSTK
jgi:hypothetical protein